MSKEGGSMYCVGIRRPTDVISCDKISLVGDHMPGFYAIWRNGERVNIVNGAYIVEVLEYEHDPDHNPITAI